MINYALALELKNAGFPQTPGINGDDVRKQIRYGFPTYVCEHGNRCGKAHCESSVYFPRLAELMDAMQARYKYVEGLINDAQVCLRKSVSGSGEVYIVWLDGDWESKELESKYYFVEDTPEVAAANLWLMLNKK